jgi:hypothetical protein
VCWVGAGELNPRHGAQGVGSRRPAFQHGLCRASGRASLIWQALSRSRGAGGASSNAVEGQDLVVPMAAPASGALQSASRCWRCTEASPVLPRRVKSGLTKVAAV